MKPKKLNNMYIFKGLVFILIFGLFSCGNVLDKIGKSQALPVKNGYVSYYRDKNILIYRPTVGLRSDSEVSMPSSFQVNLPKGMKFYEFIEPTDFVIYYRKQQVFYVRIDTDSNSNVDTVYSPDKDELEDFVENKLSFHNYKYDIQKIKLIKSRKNVIVKRGRANILLYNVTQAQFDDFLKSAQSFHFL